MNKLYKYRPLSDFLFKELNYQELYFASYNELNDPLDLSARLEFSVEQEEHLDYLLFFLFKTTIKFNDNIVTSVKTNNANIVSFYKRIEAKNNFRNVLFQKMKIYKESNFKIWLNDIENCIVEAVKIENLNFEFDLESFRNEIMRITNKFLSNSYTTCFSESKSDFLMWSHYASKHSGVCLEFILDNKGMFPYVLNGYRKLDKVKYVENHSVWEIESHIYWDRLHKVDYKTEQPFINFFEFSPVFANENDCDLIGLSKSWTHKFAFQLESIFCLKTKPWRYEKEWRAIEINFGESKQPEERIRHYPLESLSAIYFGMRTPDSAKHRIHQIFKSQHKDLKYFECKPTNGKDLEFIEWENYE